MRWASRNRKVSRGNCSASSVRNGREDKIGIDPASLLVEAGLASDAAAGASTLADIGLVSSLASAGIGAVGAIQQANASAASAKYNSEVASQNAKLAQQQATWASEAGNAQVSEQGAKTRAQVGGILAAQAANNVDVNSGSAVDVRSSASALGELNAINIRSDAARTAYGYETQASSDKAQSELDSSQAASDTIAGEVGAGSTLIGGIGNAAANYANFLSKSSPFSSGSPDVIGRTYDQPANTQNLGPFGNGG